MSLKTNKKILDCWIVTEGLAGTENQCVAVAEALGVDPVVKRIGLRQPWKFLSPYLGFENQNTFTGDSLVPPWPDLLICSGRKSIAAALYIRKKTHERCFIVQIQDPRISPDLFDLVAVVSHDKLRGQNVLVTQTAPNKITQDTLKQAAEDTIEPLDKLKDTRLAVLIGGNSKTHTLSKTVAAKLITDLQGLHHKGSNLMITASRRTPSDFIETLHQTFQTDQVYIWTPDSDQSNPYFNILAKADAVIVTEDSVSMVSDAIETQKPVYVYPLEGQSKKFDRFYQALFVQNLIHFFEGPESVSIHQIQPHSHKEARQPAATIIADEIKKRMKARELLE